MQLSDARLDALGTLVRRANDGMIVMFDALRDPCRFRIALALDEVPEACVSDIARIIDASLPGASRHLKIMEQAGLVEKRRVGQTVCYRLRKAERAVTDLLKTLRRSALIT